MKSIIIGGGKIGSNLLKTLKERGYNVTLIEKNEEVCHKIANDIEADIICGDGTDLDVLNDAGIKNADLLAAVTGKDEENLVICQIAKKEFRIKKSIARVNNPKNIAMFKALNVDQTVCSTEVIANLIEYEFDRDICKIVQTFDRGAMVLMEIKINDNNCWLNCFIKDLKLPAECVVASIFRNGQSLYARGNTQIMLDDRVYMITNHATFIKIKNYLLGGGKPYVK